MNEGPQILWILLFILPTLAFFAGIFIGWKAKEENDREAKNRERLDRAYGQYRD